MVSSVQQWAQWVLQQQADDTLPSEPLPCHSEPSLSHRQAHLSVCEERCFIHILLQANHVAYIAVIAADRASANYDIEHTPEKKAQIEREKQREALLESNKTGLQRAKEWASDNRYPLLFGFWVLSMAGSWTYVNRNPYLSGSQKIVQARMYAQGGTLAALLTSFALEGKDVAQGKGRWETIRVVDPNDPEHKHLIEKRVHHERYAGEDQWRGTFVIFLLPDCPVVSGADMYDFSPSLHNISQAIHFTPEVYEKY